MSNETHPEQSATSDSANGSNGAAGSGNEARVEELQAQIDDLKKQVEEKENRYKYLYAEFENYKKRVLKERSDLQKFGWEGVARELVQVADNLERAVKAAAPGADKSLIEGIEMVLRQFHATLEKWGVKSIDTEKQPFDPHFHEAVAQTPSPDHPEGQIVHEATKGYTLHGRLLRPARVVVSSGVPSS